MSFYSVPPLTIQLALMTVGMAICRYWPPLNQ